MYETSFVSFGVAVSGPRGGSAGEAGGRQFHLLRNVREADEKLLSRTPPKSALPATPNRRTHREKSQHGVRPKHRTWLRPQRSRLTRGRLRATTPIHPLEKDQEGETAVRVEQILQFTQLLAEINCLLVSIFAAFVIVFDPGSMSSRLSRVPGATRNRCTKFIFAQLLIPEYVRLLQTTTRSGARSVAPSNHFISHAGPALRSRR